jgi:hypothetical protein
VTVLPRAKTESLNHSADGEIGSDGAKNPIHVTDSTRSRGVVSSIVTRKDERVDMSSPSSLNSCEHRHEHKEKEESWIQTMPQSRDEVGDD